MVKLIRLLGDASKSSTEIRNTFRQPIIIKPNAKVALIGISAFLTDEIANEQFVIDSGSNQFKIGLSGNPQLATITSGDYTPQQLLRQTEIAANYSGTEIDISAGGTHHQFTYGNNVTVYTHLGHAGNLPMFGTWKNIYTANGATVTTTDDSATDSSGSIWLSDRTAIVPMVHPIFTATLANPQTYDLELGGYGKWAIGNPAPDKYGLRVTSGVYRAMLGQTSAVFSPSVSAAANDQVIIEMFAGTLKITIKNSGGTVKGTFLQTDVITRSYYGTGTPLRWGFKSPATGASITNCTCTRLTNAPITDKHELFDDNVDAELLFQSGSGNTNTNLELFLGFSSAGSSPQIYTGNPATLVAQDEMKGLPSYPGILVTVDGLGPFQSYDGANSSRAPENILYVLHDLSNITGNIIELDVPAPFFLDINNSQPINVNELRIRLIPAAGQESNPVLTFSGKPCITLLVQD